MKRIINRTTVADRILLIFMAAASISGVFAAREAVPHGPGVVIEVDGKPQYVLPLSENRTIPIDGRFGPTVVEIRDGRVGIRESHCPNHICEKQGYISQGALVCLPNHVVVLVGGPPADKKKAVDAVTG